MGFEPGRLAVAGKMGTAGDPKRPAEPLADPWREPVGALAGTVLTCGYSNTLRQAGLGSIGGIYWWGGLLISIKGPLCS